MEQKATERLARECLGGDDPVGAVSIPVGAIEERRYVRLLEPPPWCARRSDCGVCRNGEIRGAKLCEVRGNPCSRSRVGLFESPASR